MKNIKGISRKLEKLLHENQGSLYSKFSTVVGDLDEEVVLGDSHLSFDIASLTKPITFLYLYSRIEGEKISNFLPKPENDAERKIALTVEDVAEHKAGFPSYVELWRISESREEIMRKAWDLPLTEKAETYSDIGFIVLTFFVERKFSSRIDKVFVPEKFGFLQTFWLPLDEDRRKAKDKIASVKDKIASPYLHVHDKNAQAMLGVSMHAGLFATASDVSLFCKKVLHNFEFVRKRFFEIREAVKNREKRFVLSLDTFVRENKVLLGHLGFTGCAFWIDFETSRFCVVLTDRVFVENGPASEKFKNLREQIIHLVFLEGN